MPVAGCYPMGYKIIELHSDWLVLNQERVVFYAHVATVMHTDAKLRSDWSA